MIEIATAFAVWFSQYVQAASVDIAALIGAGTSLLICRHKRRKKNLGPMTRDQHYNVFFSGASVVILMLLALSAWNDKLLEFMLGQERFILVAALLFSTYDEVQRISTYWRQ